MKHGLVYRLFVAATAAALLAIGLSSGAGAKTQALTKVSVRMDFLIRGYHSGFFVALDKGWYKEAGLDVSISEGTGSLATAQSVAAGNDTFGLVDASSMVTADAQGAHLKMVANMRGRNGAAVIVRKSSGIRRRPSSPATSSRSPPRARSSRTSGRSMPRRPTSTRAR
jgi:ABC-type nitrate/sulfonate/bicarbonate transport systems, periplasmic components